jgi:carboxylate-amine ligase
MPRDLRPTGGWTIGVEQEFVLVDPRSREPVAKAPEVRAVVETGRDLDVQEELAPSLIEVTTGVCTDMAELVDQIRLGRERLASAARQVGARLMATGVAPVGEAGPPPGADEPRYHRIAAAYRRLVEGQAVCGCHVHIGLPDRRTAVEVANRFRPWLPVLLALFANSPVHQGVDTGYASWRYPVWSRWPVSGPPPHFESVRQHDQTVDALIASGVLIDARMLYWDIRLSSHLPTIELRIPDIPMTVGETELLAELTLALVSTSLAETTNGTPPPPVSDSVLRAACWRAARDGVSGHGVRLSDGRTEPAWDLVDRLVEHVRPALDTRHRMSIVDKRLRWMRDQGCGADRQRQVLVDSGDPRSLVDHLIEQTLAD